VARIVVIPEIPANHRRVRESLAEHEILAFQKLHQAMRFINRNPVDLVISAVHLVDGNVFDFLHWMKADNNLRTIPVVFFCAEPTELARYVSGAVKSAALILGASGYIAMDEFDSVAFREVITEILGQEAPQLTDEQLARLLAWSREQATRN
jgi:CheY-like chemotaxis protein